MIRRRWLVLGSLLLAAGAGALVAALLSRGHGARQVVFTPAVLGGQPPHAVVLAAEDRDLAVALAVQPRRGQLLLVATVIGQDGKLNCENSSDFAALECE